MRLATASAATARLRPAVWQAPVLAISAATFRYVSAPSGEQTPTDFEQNQATLVDNELVLDT